MGDFTRRERKRTKKSKRKIFKEKEGNFSKKIFFEKILTGTRKTTKSYDRRKSTVDGLKPDKRGSMKFTSLRQSSKN